MAGFAFHDHTKTVGLYGAHFFPAQNTVLMVEKIGRDFYTLNVSSK